MQHVISKSRFLAGWQCEKRLWFEIHLPQARKIGPETQFIFEQGNRIGALARDLRPAGVEIKADFKLRDQAVAETKRAVAAGAPAMFEAAAAAEGAFARADILIRAENGQWEMVEVKTSGYKEEEDLAKEKEQFIWDLALQRFVFEHAGYNLKRTSLALVNKAFVKQGPVKADEFFKLEDVGAEVSSRLGQVPEMLQRFHSAAALLHEPQKKIGLQCDDPYECPFKHLCWADVPEYSVFNLRLLKKKKAFELYHAGTRSVEDVDRNGKLTDFQHLQLQALDQGKRIINQNEIKAFLKALEYPLYHLDFETVFPAFPPFEGLSPFKQTPFQFSLHVQDQPGAEAKHFEYLPEHENDPRQELAKGLLEHIGKKGTVLAYNAGFEKARLADLAQAFPQYGEALNQIKDRVLDLMTPFAKGYFYDAKFKGSVSMKRVLPALVPGMSYDLLAIGEGGAASRAYLEILNPAASLERRAQLRKDLKAYCGQDTEAMVRVLGVLEKCV